MMTLSNVCTVFTGIVATSSDSILLSELEVFVETWKQFGKICILDGSLDPSLVNSIITENDHTKILRFQADVGLGNMEDLTWDWAMKICETPFALLSHIDNYPLNTEGPDALIGELVQSDAAVAAFMDHCPPSERHISLCRLSPIVAAVNILHWRDLGLTWSNKKALSICPEVQFTQWYGGDVSSVATAYASYLQHQLGKNVFRVIPDNKKSAFKHFNAYGSADLNKDDVHLLDGKTGAQNHFDYLLTSFTAFYQDIMKKELTRVGSHFNAKS